TPWRCLYLKVSRHPVAVRKNNRPPRGGGILSGPRSDAFDELPQTRPAARRVAGGRQLHRTDLARVGQQKPVAQRQELPLAHKAGGRAKQLGADCLGALPEVFEDGSPFRTRTLDALERLGAAT